MQMVCSRAGNQSREWVLDEKRKNLFYFVLINVFAFLFLGKIFSFPGTHSVDKVGFELTEIHMFLLPEILK